MKKIVAMMAALMIIGGVAVAQGGDRGITCSVNPEITTQTFANPAEAFEYIYSLDPRLDDPEDILAISPEADSVGGLIAMYCTTPGDDKAETE